MLNLGLVGKYIQNSQAKAAIFSELIFKFLQLNLSETYFKSLQKFLILSNAFFKLSIDVA